MLLSSWIGQAGELSDDGPLEREGRIVSNRPEGISGSTIIRRHLFVLWFYWRKIRIGGKDE